MGALSYADDITIMCPSIGGLNKMLKICHNFAQSNSIILKNKKTACIKFGREIVKNKKAVLDTHVLNWKDKINISGIVLINIVTRYLIVILKNLYLLDMLTS